MAELNEISRVQSHFSPHFLLIFLIYLARALAILCKLANSYPQKEINTCKPKNLNCVLHKDPYWPD